MDRWHKVVISRPMPTCPPFSLARPIEHEEAVVDLLNRTVKLPYARLDDLDTLKRAIDYAVEQANLFIEKG